MFSSKKAFGADELQKLFLNFSCPKNPDVESFFKIKAVSGGAIVGAVAYLGPTATKSSFFPESWAVMRMLVVCPKSRNKGISRALAIECIAKAERDGVKVFGLHTSPIMSVALPMYQSMGFEFISNAPPIHGVQYGIYAKQLTGQSCVS